MAPQTWWLWVIAGCVFVWCGLVAFAEALVRALV